MISLSQASANHDLQAVMHQIDTTKAKMEEHTRLAANT